MNKNEIVISHINSELNKVWNYLETTSFEELIKKEISEIDRVKFIPSAGLSASEMKEINLNELNSLLENKYLINYMDQFHHNIKSLNNSRLESQLGNDFLQSIKESTQSKVNDANENPVGLILIEYDFEHIASVSGYEKGKFDFPILKTPKYINYDYKKEIFQSVMNLDLRNSFYPFLNIEENLGKENFELIEETTTFEFEYRENLYNLFLLNCCKNLSNGIQKLSKEIIKLNLNLEQEIYVYINEHDCEKRNVCILTTAI